MKSYSIMIIIFVISSAMIAGTAQSSANIGKTEIIRNFSSIATYFIENRGQIDNESVRYYMKAPGKDIYLTDTGVVMDFYNIINDWETKKDWQTESLPHKSNNLICGAGSQPAIFHGGKWQTESLPYNLLPDNKKCLSTRKYGVVIKMNFIGANLSCAEGENELITKLHYFLGNDPNKWQSNIPAYKDVIYKNIYPGINLRFCATSEKLKYQFEIAPGGNPSDIKIHFTGIDGITIDNNKNLIMNTQKGNIVDEKLYLYQIVSGKKVEISAYLELIDSHTCGFKIDHYNAELPLIVDPGIVFSTYLGVNMNVRSAIVTYTPGNVYVTGSTYSGAFPTTPGAYDTSYNDWDDATVSKLSADGSTLLYSTFLGGSYEDFGRSIGLDGSGNIYVAGITASSNFAVTPGAFDTSYNGGTGWGNDVFVSKLSADGSRLIYSTYIGGTKDEVSFDFGWDVNVGLAVDNPGNAYIAGFTESTDFPTTPGAFDTSFNGVYDAFVCKLSDDGATLIYSTFIGGNSLDMGIAIILDDTTNAFITGLAHSTDFPTTPGAYNTISNGNDDVFVCKLNDTGSALLYSTYLGGAGRDFGNSIVIDSAGNAYVTGRAGSSNFPTTPSAYDRSYTFTSEAFLTKLSADGSSLIYSTYLGGTGRDEGKSIAVDAAGNAYITGTTDSTDFPVTPDAFDPDYKDRGDIFISKLSADGSALLYSTYLGGDAGEESTSIAVHDSNYVYISGATASRNFPTTPGAYQTFFTTSGSNFITKFDLSSSSLPFLDISHIMILDSILSLMLVIFIQARKN